MCNTARPAGPHLDAAGERCFVRPGSGNDCVRLSFSAPTPERIREGVTRLAATVRDEIAAALATP